MNLEAAEFVFYGITAVVVVVWLLALQFMLNTSRRQKTAAEQQQELQQLGTAPPENLLAGSAELAGAPGELAAKAAAFLAKQGTVMLGPVKILEQTAERVVFEGMQGMGQNPGGMGCLFSRGELRFTPVAQNRTRVNYAVDVPPRSWLLSCGWLFVGLGLLAIVTGFLLIQLYVVNAANPGLRWQSVQMIHAGHFVWPPFLFGGIYRKFRTYVRTGFDTLVHNLPYHQA
jgi:hypothetical protein